MNVGFQLGSSLASKHLIDADNIKGGYCVVADTNARNALPCAYGDNDGIIVVGSRVYCQSDGKMYKCTAISNTRNLTTCMEAGRCSLLLHNELVHNGR